MSNVDPDGLQTRNLNSSERTAFRSATRLLGQNGFSAAALTYRLLLDFEPDRIQVDPELGGAGWRYGVLYLSPTLLQSTDWSASTKPKLRSMMQATSFEEKAWLASILRHEWDHVMHNETGRLFFWNQRKVENRAWQRQIDWLNQLQQKHQSDPARAGRIGNFIDRAKEGKRENG